MTAGPSTAAQCTTALTNLSLTLFRPQLSNSWKIELLSVTSQVAMFNETCAFSRKLVNKKAKPSSGGGRPLRDTSQMLFAPDWIAALAIINPMAPVPPLIRTVPQEISVECESPIFELGVAANLGYQSAPLAKDRSPEILESKA
jgi:hypothetical protein